jgi:uncharacterized membrane protein YphA (DoxX/SURF4 family)
MQGSGVNVLSFDSAADWAGIAVLLFLAILFLQSGLDKVFDRAGNLEYLMSHFANSPLKALTPVLFLAITVLEVSAGALSAIGAVAFVVSGSTQIAVAASFVAVTAFLSLFFGQRMAKDYAGAAALVPYFLVGIAAILLTQAM